MRIFFSVGEPSGDLHGSNLIRRLKATQPGIECVGFGGPKMADVGCKIHYDLTQKAVMFFWDAIKQLKFFFGLVDQADQYFSQHSIDAVVLIDYPGFNWWIAKKAKQRGIPVYYYGVPQMWAWAPWRVRKIRKYVDHVLCKLPFEPEWFGQRNCQATYVGHPYFDQTQRQSYDAMFLQSFRQQEVVTILPGSRDREVTKNLPTLLRAAQRVADERPETHFAVACFNEKHLAMAEEIVRQTGVEIANLKLFTGRTPELMVAATACMACSGSVCMELLHHRKPTVIVYQIKRWHMVLQSFLLRTKFITLVNLMAAKDIRKDTWSVFNPDADTEEARSVVMPEYMTAGDVSVPVANQLLGWLRWPQRRQEKVKQLDELAKRYAIAGASDRAADYILKTLDTAEGTRLPAAKRPHRNRVA